MVFGLLLSNGRQRVGAFKKRACPKNAFKHNRIQWNAGTACVSECVLKRCGVSGLRVGPSKAITHASASAEFAPDLDSVTRPSAL